MTMRPQAFEIIRTWLFYTIVKAHFHADSLPWTTAMISGWGLDKQGKKMSKRLGNLVDPYKVIERYSADALRYWTATPNLGHDLRYDERDVAGGKRIVTKLWNSTKFMKMNLGDHRPGLEGADYRPTPIDRWVLSKLHGAIRQATCDFERYEYAHALRAAERFFWEVLCDNYLEIIKDRFWSPEDYAPEATAAARETLYRCSWDVLRLFAPFLPYITEELFQRVFRPFEGGVSIHTAPWPESDASRIDPAVEGQGDLLLIVVDGIRKFKTSLQIHQGRKLTRLAITCPGEVRASLEALGEDLRSAVRAAEVKFAEGGTAPTDRDDITLEIEIAPVEEA